MAQLYAFMRVRMHMFFENMLCTVLLYLYILVIIFILYIEYFLCLFQLMGAPGRGRGWKPDSLLIRQLDITTRVFILNG